MSIYDHCLELNTALQADPSLEETSEELTVQTETAISTVPALLRKQDHGFSSATVYYISDLHLDQHLVAAFPDGATDEQAADYIRGIVRQLLSGEILEEIQRFHSPFVFIGGDVAASFSLAQLFYSSFVAEWKAIEAEVFSEVKSKCTPIEEKLEKLKAEEKELEEKKNTATPEESRKIDNKIRGLHVRIGNQEQKLKEITWGLSYRWEEKIARNPGPVWLYTILGNHEFWDFASYDACLTAYEDLFSSLRIRFLNSSIESLGRYQRPVQRNSNDLLTREENPVFYDLQMLSNSNVLIVGGVGYARNNPQFNANQMIYSAAISPELESRLSEKWISEYQKARDLAAKHYSTLIVFSHMPPSDWLPDDELPENCVFICGHTHRNLTFFCERNSYIIADNQVGYHNNSFFFRKALLYKPRNPFAAAPDGYHTISLLEYKEFSWYFQETPGTGILERYVRKNENHLYMVKRNGYYGFFLSTQNGIYICNGGQIRKVGEPADIAIYDLLFTAMVDCYLRALSPLRRVQERVSEAIKSFGGTGDIHGSIVDIDFFNHIMFDMDNHCVRFYYSPSPGRVQYYSDLTALIHDQRPLLETSYLQSGYASLFQSDKLMPGESETELINVSLTSNGYRSSRRINALQRLFDKQILRDWNTDLLWDESKKQTPAPYALEE